MKVADTEHKEIQEGNAQQTCQYFHTEAFLEVPQAFALGTRLIRQLAEHLLALWSLNFDRKTACIGGLRTRPLLWPRRGRLDERTVWGRLAGMSTKTLDGIDLWDPLGLEIDDDPARFVDLGRSPVVFTIVGARYFAPRFRHVGVDISTIVSAQDFAAARRRWDEVEWVLLQEHVQSKGKPGAMADAHNALKAVLDFDADQFEAHVRALEHAQRAGLRLVATAPAPPDGGDGNSLR